MQPGNRYFVTADTLITHCALEFQQGPYDSHHWKTDSLYLDDELFETLGLYPLFAEAIPDFDHYGPSVMGEAQLQALLRLAKAAGGEVERAVSELAVWTKIALRTHPVITVCGI